MGVEPASGCHLESPPPGGGTPPRHAPGQELEPHRVGRQGLDAGGLGQELQVALQPLAHLEVQAQGGLPPAAPEGRAGDAAFGPCGSACTHPPGPRAHPPRCPPPATVGESSEPCSPRAGFPEVTSAEESLQIKTSQLKGAQSVLRNLVFSGKTLTGQVLSAGTWGVGAGPPRVLPSLPRRGHVPARALQDAREVPRRPGLGQ